METLLVRGLSDAGGINTDRHPVLLAPNTFTDCVNVQFRFGAAETRYGDEPTFQVYQDGEFIIVADFDPIMLYAHGSDWYYGGDTSLAKILPVSNEHFNINRRLDFIYEGGVFPEPDAEPEDYSETERWDSGVLSEVLFFNSKQNIPQVYHQDHFGEFCINMPFWGWTDLQHRYPGGTSSTGGEVVDTPGGPDPEHTDNDPLYWNSWSSTGMIAYKNFLVAYDLLEGSESYPQRVRWSDAALPGYAPQNWNSSSLQSLAGFNDLSEATGPILYMAPLGDAIVVYTEDESFLMSYVGGQEVMNFKKLFDEGGILNANCAIEFEGKHFVVGGNDVYIHDSSSKNCAAEDAVRSELFGYISRTDTKSVKVFHNPSRHEIWILYSSVIWGEADAKGYPMDMGHVYDYSTNCWSKITLPGLTDIAIGRTFQTTASTVTTWDRINEIGLVWDQISESWRPRNTQSFGNQVIKGCRRGDSVEGAYFFDISADPEYKYDEFPRYLEKVGIAADTLKIQGGTTSVYFTDIFPVLSSFSEDGFSGKVRFTVTGTLHPTDPVDWENNVEVFEFEADDHSTVDIRQTWQYLAVRIEFIDPVPYRLYSMDLTARPRGSRTGREIK